MLLLPPIVDVMLLRLQAVVVAVACLVNVYEVVATVAAIQRAMVVAETVPAV